MWLSFISENVSQHSTVEKQTEETCGSCSFYCPRLCYLKTSLLQLDSGEIAGLPKVYRLLVGEGI